MDARIIFTFGAAGLVALLAGCPGQKDTAPKAGGEQPNQAASQPAGSQGGAAHAVAAFSGDITVAPESKDKVKPADVLFIIARESMNGSPGRLVATQRHADVKFPLHFEMSEKDLMVPGSAFTGPFIVNARLDKDGDPMTKGPDDLYAVHEGEVKGGEKNLTLELKAATMVPNNAASQPASH